MKIDITKDEQHMLLQALDSLEASTSRAINTERNQQIKQLREQSLHQVKQLQAKMLSQEIIK